MDRRYPCAPDGDAGGVRRSLPAERHGGDNEEQTAVDTDDAVTVQRGDNEEQTAVDTDDAVTVQPRLVLIR